MVSAETQLRRRFDLRRVDLSGTPAGDRQTLNRVIG